LKRSNKRTPAVERRHAHNHARFHENNKEVRDIQDAEVEKRQLGVMVTAVMNGVTVSWANNYDGKSTTTVAAASSTKAPVVAAFAVASSSAAAASSSAAVSSAAKASASSAQAASSSAQASSSSSAAKAASSSSASAAMPLASGSWARAGYYSSVQGISQGLSFLNHLGGGASGTFD